MSLKKYNVEFTLLMGDWSLKSLKDSLVDVCSDLIIEEKEKIQNNKIIKICMSTRDPYLVFDVCSEFGRLKSIKVDESEA